MRKNSMLKSHMFRKVLVMGMFITCQLMLVVSLLSCSESKGEEEEYANWQERNDNALSQWASDTSLQKIKKWSMDASQQGAASDYIYYKVIESGSGTQCPMYTDTVRISYRGRYIPTKTYPDGYVFDQTYFGDFNWKTAGVAQGKVGGFVDGFTTAVMNMHVGDRWLVYIPYQLGYGASSSSSSIPNHTNLVFDIAMVDFWQTGESHPSFKAREK